MKRIVILTGSELRHSFFRKWLGLRETFQVVRSYCEGTEKSLGALVEKQEVNHLRLMHLRAREQSEEDFFKVFLASTPDRSNPVFLPKGEINAPGRAEEIIRLQPDLVLAYGCSLVREPLLSAFSGQFINVHLGLSPYYRGSGTNFWPLVNGEPEYVGATFMHIDAGVDTGEVIHQLRARVAPGDTPAQIGNRLIVHMTEFVPLLIERFEKLSRVAQIAASPGDKIYRKKDYTEVSVATLYANFRDGLIERYLENQTVRCAAAPLVQQPGLSGR